MTAWQKAQTENTCSNSQKFTALGALGAVLLGQAEDAGTRSSAPVQPAVTPHSARGAHVLRKHTHTHTRVVRYKQEQRQKDEGDLGRRGGGAMPRPLRGEAWPKTVTSLRRHVKTKKRLERHISVRKKKKRFINITKSEF